MTSAIGQRNHRYVDRDNQSWYLTADSSGREVFAADFGNPPPEGKLPDRFHRDLRPRNFEQLIETRSPLRPVLTITDADQELLGNIFRSAGRKTITTIAAALEQVFHQLRTEHGGLRDRNSYDFALRTLTAGRAGSWESALLHDIVLFGNELNLAKAAPRQAEFDIEARRAGGPKKRVDKAARDTLAAILRQWVTDPARYTEVAANLAAVVSTYCDTVGPHGWTAVADQWLQPRSLAHDTFAMCYRLFYSTSQHYDVNVI
jgi:hypothetical protein